MFDRDTANDIVRRIWERDGALPVKKVEKELRAERQGRATDAVAKAIKRFLGPSGQPEADAVAFLDDADESGANTSGSDTPPKTPTRKKTARSAISTSVSETENAAIKNELARMTQQASETTDRVARLEERLLVRETENAGLAAELALRSKEARETDEVLARLEERLVALETDDERMLARLTNAHRLRREAFRKRVKNTVSEIMHAHEDLTVHDILELIPPEMHLEAERLRQSLDVPKLAELLGIDLSQDGRRDTASNED